MLLLSSVTLATNLFIGSVFNLKTEHSITLGKRREAPLPNRRALRPTPRLEQAHKPDAKRAPIMVVYAQLVLRIIFKYTIFL